MGFMRAAASVGLLKLFLKLLLNPWHCMQVVLRCFALQKWKKKRGRLDITVTLQNGDLLGIELIRNSDDPTGHHNRFTTGPYRKLKLKQWAIVDFRHPGCTRPLPVPHPDNYYIIQFLDGYKRARLLRPDGTSMELLLHSKDM